MVEDWAHISAMTFPKLARSLPLGAMCSLESVYVYVQHVYFSFPISYGATIDLTAGRRHSLRATLLLAADAPYA